MFGSFNFLENIENKLCKTQFSPIDVLIVLGVNGSASYLACGQDDFRVKTPVIGEIIEKNVPEWAGFLSDGRFWGGLACAAAAHYGCKPVGVDAMGQVETKFRSGTLAVMHDATAGLWSSLVATETCRYMAEKQAIAEGRVPGTKEAGGDLNMLGLDDFGDDSFVLDEDLLGLDDYVEAGSMNFAYGW